MKRSISLVSSAFSRCPFSISSCSSRRTLFWKWIITGLPICWIGLVSFFSGYQFLSPLLCGYVWTSPQIRWVFSYFSRPCLCSGLYWCFYCLVVQFGVCLTSESNPRNICVFSFSVMSIGITTLLFSALTSTNASLLNSIVFCLHLQSIL